MKLEITDEYLGTRSIDVEAHEELIADQLRLLKFFLKRDGKKAKPALRDDIAFYEWILRQENPREVANEYLNGKDRLRKGGVLPMGFNHEYADLLGMKWRPH